MFKYCIYFIFLLAFQSLVLKAQKPEPKSSSEKPKLIIGIVIDQMRNDYIYRYWNRYGTGGFKRLVNEGFYFKNTHYNYTPTYTGPGHASIYTGATPRHHGVIANDWYVKSTNSKMYCVQDTFVKTIGSVSKNGRMSPKNELSTTIGDELKINSNLQSKVFSIALKDRGAILPGGHAANAAFWFDDLTGNFISSSWYLNTLPKWLNQFNDQKFAQQYLEKGWATLYPIKTYTSSGKDSTAYESAPGNAIPVFPYDYSYFLSKNNYAIIKATPYGNSLTLDLALACIKNESLGKDTETDLLTLSFSSPDYVGHSFGIRSVEIEDVYLRLDKDLGKLLNYLDKEVGKGNYTVFLTADHGAAEVPDFLADAKIPAGLISEKEIIKQVKKHFAEVYQDTSFLANISNEQIFLNAKKIEELKLNLEKVEIELANFLPRIKGIAEAYPSEVLKNGTFSNQDLRSLLQNGYNHKLSGNVSFVFEPGWIDHGHTGTTHGSGYAYDTHVPLLFFGNGIKKGETYTYSSITQIAPTITELLKISRPNASFSEPLNNYFK
jgi:predicted AlkP superfamily pyrophosphatase or phosphodiesterase